jgi:uncharacterized protein
MVEKIIGREEEQAILKAAYQSTEAELLVIYGRRRIGKTFLIRNYFENKLLLSLRVHSAHRCQSSCEISAVRYRMR